MRSHARRDQIQGRSNESESIQRANRVRGQRPNDDSSRLGRRRSCRAVPAEADSVHSTSKGRPSCRSAASEGEASRVEGRGASASCWTALRCDPCVESEDQHRREGEEERREDEPWRHAASVGERGRAVGHEAWCRSGGGTHRRRSSVLLAIAASNAASKDRHDDEEDDDTDDDRDGFGNVNPRSASDREATKRKGGLTNSDVEVGPVPTRRRRQSVPSLTVPAATPTSETAGRAVDEGRLEDEAAVGGPRRVARHLTGVGRARA